MKLINLTKNKFTIVDDEDFDRVSQYKWYANKNGYFYYAIRTVIDQDRQYNLYMHRFILDAKRGDIIDHINGNGLDNRRLNLRFCNKMQNGQNRFNTYGFSKFRGVSWRKDRNRWRSYIVVNGKQKSLGHYVDEIDAAKEYDKAAIKYFGEYASLNFRELLYEDSKS